jgi:two-component system, LytTR family, sensor kinase
MKRNYRVIVFHMLYWIAVVLFFTVHFSSQKNFENFYQMLLVNTAYLPGGLAFTYFNIYYLIPKFIYRNKITLFILFQSILLLIYPVFVQLVTVTLVDPFITGVTTRFYLATYFSRIIIYVIGIAPLAAYRVAKKIVNDNNIRKELAKQKLETELKFREAELKLLKAQIQPHFLFNTLNNLYSLSIAKSDKTSEVILKISDLLNYIIYECSKEKVPLNKEVEFICNYIELEKLRYDDSLKVTIDISGNLNYQIIPMILYTFVENSFKHGASKDTGSAKINMSIQIINHKMRFSIVNSKTADTIFQVRGIGIENAKKRLQLIYPECHTLTIKEEEKIYSVTMDLQLN